MAPCPSSTSSPPSDCSPPSRWARWRRCPRCCSASPGSRWPPCPSVGALLRRPALGKAEAPLGDDLALDLARPAVDRPHHRHAERPLELARERRPVRFGLQHAFGAEQVDELAVAALVRLGPEQLVHRPFDARELPPPRHPPHAQAEQP